MNIYEKMAKATEKIAKVAKGLTVETGKVANERFNRDTAEVLYKTAQENINAIKLQIRILDAQIAREWGRNE